MQRQWSSATDIPWHTLEELPDDIEAAECKLATFLTEVEFVAGDVPGRWISEITPEYYEPRMFLISQVVDEARHLDVFRKRALANGGGLMERNPARGRGRLRGHHRQRAGLHGDVGQAAHLRRGLRAHHLPHGRAHGLQRGREGDLPAGRLGRGAPRRLRRDAPPVPRPDRAGAPRGDPRLPRRGRAGAGHRHQPEPGRGRRTPRTPRSPSSSAAARTRSRRARSWRWRCASARSGSTSSASPWPASASASSGGRGAADMLRAYASA